MSSAGRKLLEAAKEMRDFAAGENTKPMTLWMPNGTGGLAKREVANMDEYKAVWEDEGMRAIDAAFKDAPR
ncbi:MAG: hypothetical protein ACTHJQ_19060 [Rhizobiaceae bacterium]|jgi:hypothetical protein